MLNESLFSSTKQDWATPNDLFQKLNSVFNFTVDVCADSHNNKCPNYYSPDIDGLKQNWIGQCWMNPPYNREQITWINKAYDESLKSASQVVCLIPARPDTRVWHNTIFKNAKAICFIKGRLKFGDSKDSAPFPSALIIFGDDLNCEQIKCLENIGKLVIKGGILMEQESFSIYSFSEALANLRVGHDIERNNLRLRLEDDTIMMVIEEGILTPWMATHKDILAKDWKVIRLG